MNLIISWICQLIAAGILAMAAWGKFSDTAMAVHVFSALEMGDGGRFLIGAIEAAAALLLIYPAFAHWGALLGFGTMLGASIAHITVLGFDVAGDEGSGVGLLAVVLISSSAVMYIHRRKLPLLGAIFS